MSKIFLKLSVEEIHIDGQLCTYTESRKPLIQSVSEHDDVVVPTLLSRI